ncbi:MAG: Ku protein [Longimicrobiales bacterium]
MARAIWKGTIRFGDAEVPVKLYSAVQDRGVHFRLLHKKDNAPVEQRMVNPVTNRIIAPEDIRKGYEVERGVFVVLDDEELAELEPEPSREIEVTRFVAPEHVDHPWYDRPYFLGPDGDEAAYFALAAALAKQGKEGVARWVMRKRPYVGALRSEGDHLVLITLRHADEVVPVSEIEGPAGRKLDAREVRMARQLVHALEDEFDPTAFRDEFRERVLQLVKAKAKGRKIALEPPREKPETRDLSRMLEQSLNHAKREKRVA